MCYAVSLVFHPEARKATTHLGIHGCVPHRLACLTVLCAGVLFLLEDPHLGMKAARGTAPPHHRQAPPPSPPQPPQTPQHCTQHSTRHHTLQHTPLMVTSTLTQLQTISMRARAPLGMPGTTARTTRPHSTVIPAMRMPRPTAAQGGMGTNTPRPTRLQRPTTPTATGTSRQVTCGLAAGRWRQVPERHRAQCSHRQ